ncbi:mevalonate kinase [Candidatus Peribacteria bacterium RIFCSPLOWO2_01_FULL_51_18]|nr:MAG: mevalonate kinase [Candidatus Peribacteria bacterium RIFCSPHIGHO2_02_FULL_51_15]OGJ66641.1 MAG: mevalonate kinase [Candidatus Peribacteria bacterium RIFCSPLOWO2_01_FULL_51_18]OGJ69426.1 MAG: mevalonate kinase [Candidatus Peribacteria bacterium RIFCSPLOWO2_02_FULL_51_10]
MSLSQKVTVSVPGKLMFFGEHAVLFGYPCIVTAVGRRMKTTVEIANEPVFSLNAPDVKISRYLKPMASLGKGEIPRGAKFVETAVKIFLSDHPGIKGGVSIKTRSDFSSEMGFGSSAASVVGVLGALYELTEGKINKTKIFDQALKTVLEVQGKGSGFDIAAAVFGGTLFYAIGKKPEVLKLKKLPIIVGYTGIKTDTVKVIDEINARSDKYPEIFKTIYLEIGRLSAMAKTALEKSEWRKVGELMDINQGFLEVLGVGSLKLASMIHAAREAGALGAKLSGAGKGDCMIALADSDQRSVVSRRISKAGGTVIDIPCNAEGLKLES